jgi:hypothetical protein
MHKRFKERIEALEEARRQQTQPAHVIILRAVDRHGQPLEATVATAPNFISRRADDESFTAICLAKLPPRPGAAGLTDSCFLAGLAVIKYEVNVGFGLRSDFAGRWR